MKTKQARSITTPRRIYILTVYNLLFISVFLIACASSHAESYYYNASLRDLTLESGKLPSRKLENLTFRLQRERAPDPYAVLDSPGEVYIYCTGDRTQRWNRKNHLNVCLGEWRLAASSIESNTLRGTLFAESSDSLHLVPLRFSLKRGKKSSGNKESFMHVRINFYNDLIDRRVPGASWFRQKINTNKSIAPGQNPIRQRRSSLEEAFSMFSGGRAVAENLKLDQQLPITETTARTVDLSTIEGITIQEFDWKEKLGTSKPNLDFLSRYIPQDQYGLFFSQFSNLIKMIDQSSEQSLPILDLLESTAEDAGSKQFYQEQLLLSLNDFVKQFGEKIIDEVAVTSSDPYFRTGTDLALLFRGKDGNTLNINAISIYMRSQYQRAIHNNPKLQHGIAKVNNYDYYFVRSKDRKLSSYVAKIDNIVVITNSLEQLKAIVNSATNPIDSMQSLDEYRYFRTRYPLGYASESAFLMVTDAAIRKWSGPKWRIAAARRTQAAAVIGDLRTQFLESLHEENLNQAKIETGRSFTKLPDIKLKNGMLHSDEYGSLAFLTPISELEILSASQQEADLYKRFRDNYQNRWARFFDPIAIRFELDREKTMMDLSIVPLIQNTDYRDFLEFTGGQFIGENAPNFSSNDIFRFTIAPRKDSMIFQQASGFSSMLTPALTNPLGWIGNYISVGFGKSTYWEEAAKQERPERYLEENYQHIPASITFDVQDTLRLTTFLTGIRAMVTQSAPGLTVWENLEHAGKQYVRVSGSNRARNGKDPKTWSVYYGVLPSQLLVSLDESYVKHSLQEISPKKSLRLNQHNHIEVELSNAFLDVMETLAGESYRQKMKQRCFDNIPILNEWKRNFNVDNPTTFYKKHWNSTLRCPGGGTYRWNKEWQTVESTIFGHPGKPIFNKSEFRDPLKQYGGAQFSLTFEDDGLRTNVLLKSNE